MLTTGPSSLNKLIGFSKKKNNKKVNVSSEHAAEIHRWVGRILSNQNVHKAVEVTRKKSKLEKNVLNIKEFVKCIWEEQQACEQSLVTATKR